MTYPVFASGDVLNASDMNAVGEWLITGGSFTGVSNIIVNNCFTSTYRNYRLVVHVTASSSANPVEGQINLRASGTNSSASYYYVRTGATYAGVTSLENGNNLSRWFIGRTNGSGSAGGSNAFNVVFYGPQIADRTWFGGSAADGSYGAQVTGYHDVQTSYDGFQMTYVANNTGTYRIYGLRDS